jgi:hypothetical protein
VIWHFDEEGWAIDVDDCVQPSAVARAAANGNRRAVKRIR